MFCDPLCVKYIKIIVCSKGVVREWLIAHLEIKSVIIFLYKFNFTIVMNDESFINTNTNVIGMNM